MTTEFVTIKAMYASNVIGKMGKSELIAAYLERFPKKNRQQFHEVMTRSGKNTRIPTPQEEDWLIKHVKSYYTRYKAHIDQEPKSENTQLSIPL